MSPEERKRAQLEYLSGLWDRVESGEVLSAVLILETSDTYSLETSVPRMGSVQILGTLSVGERIVHGRMESAG